MAVTAGVHHYSQTRAKPARQRKTPEADLQAAVVAYLGFALPPGVYRIRGATEGAKRRGRALYTATGQGLSKGWPDLMLFNRQTRTYRWLELKRPKTATSRKGTLTDEQKEVIAELGDHVAVCHCVEDVRDAIIRWGITPRVALDQAHRYAVAAGGPGR